MKKLIYSKEDLDLILSLEIEEKDKEIERLNKENEELKKIQCTFLGTGCKAEIERLKQDNEYLNKVNIELSTEKNRLNNIINELEKWAEDYRFANIFKDKLQELKGSDK